MQTLYFFKSQSIPRQIGYFTRLKTAYIIPRDPSIPLRERKLIYLAQLIECYLEGDGDSIVPPAVKKIDETRWVTVDGHNRLLVADLFLGESYVHVPSHKLDLFTEKMTPGVPKFMREDLNGTIKRMFDLANKVNNLN